MNLIRALAVVALLAVGSLAFAQCCPGDGACPVTATQGPTLAVLTSADILERAIASSEAIVKTVGDSFGETNKRGEKLFSETELTEEQITPLKERYFKIVGLLRYAQNVVGYAKFEAEFIQDDAEFLDTTRQVLKSQKALVRAQVLVDELNEALDTLAPKVAVQPVEALDDGAVGENDG